jgi:hypothetical protein
MQPDADPIWDVQADTAAEPLASTALDDVMAELVCSLAAQPPPAPSPAAGRPARQEKNRKVRAR